MVPRWTLTNAIRGGHLVRQYPCVYVARPQATDPLTRRRAALAYAGDGAALSHTSALAMWGLDGDEPEVHITIPAARRLDGHSGLAVHNRRGFTATPPLALIRQGLPAVALERALVESWPLSTGSAQRAPLIQAIAERMTTPERVGQALATIRALPGRGGLRHLLDQLAAGCRSEFEIWGYESVFNAPGMPPFRRQVPCAPRFPHGLPRRLRSGRAGELRTRRRALAHLRAGPRAGSAARRCPRGPGHPRRPPHPPPATTSRHPSPRASHPLGPT